MLQTAPDALPRWIIPTGAISAFIAVAAGAFGAHALKTRLDANALQSWETAARYQMFHALGLLLSAGLNPHVRSGGIRGTALCFSAGTFIFSGSLYLLALSGEKWLGAITPVGGFLFIVGWLILAINACIYPKISLLP